MQTVNGLFESAEPAEASAAGPEAKVISPRRPLTSGLPDGRLVGKHRMGKIKGKRANCKLCTWYCVRGSKAYDSKSAYFCKQCGDYLHFECFDAYHDETAPASQFEG